MASTSICLQSEHHGERSQKHGIMKSRSLLSDPDLNRSCPRRWKRMPSPTASAVSRTSSGQPSLRNQ